MIDKFHPQWMNGRAMIVDCWGGEQLSNALRTTCIPETYFVLALARGIVWDSVYQGSP